jgi:hypothetical protein
MANLSHKDVVSAFEKRYDHQSARNVLNQALSLGGLAAKDSYSDAELARIGEGLKALGERMVDTIFESLAGGPAGGGAAAPKEAPKEEAKAEAKDEAKAKAKDEKAEEKADDKAEGDKKGEKKEKK